jgi:site-specific recombinase
MAFASQIRMQSETGLRQSTEHFCAAKTLCEQTDRFIRLFSGIWHQSSDSAFQLSLTNWLDLLDRDHDLQFRFQQPWNAMLGSLDFSSFFAETGVPAQHSLLPEITSRLFQRVLPPPREDTDAMRLFAAIFASPRAVRRFLNLDADLFSRLATVLWDPRGLAAFPRVHENFNEALRLLAARVSARGTSVAVRQRSNPEPVEKSPFYAFVFATEKFIGSECLEPPVARIERWLEAVYACRGALALVRLRMEDAGVSTALVFDLCAMEDALDRMELLTEAMVEHMRKPLVAARMLLNTLVSGLLEDTRVLTLIQENVNLLARKTVERTGHGGEHYIAHDRQEYWRMWRAAIGGGILTVFTAAIKLHIIGQSWPPFVEAVLVGTTYAASFILLLVFGLALATKQPSMTGATLANIIRRNRGNARRDKITEFAASISRTQFAAALGNIIAVCSGAVIFDQLWRRAFHEPYLPTQQAEHIYHSLRPLGSPTAIDAVLTGIILWLAGLIGGWCENLAVYHHVPAAIAQHPVGNRIGFRRMQRLAYWFDRNIAPWSASIALGYLMGFAPVISKFFGLPLDIRHVTLNTGMFAFSAAHYGSSAFREPWLYTAVGGIAIMFVLNLGVSFGIASYVALRAYDVRREEHLSILRYVLKQIVRSPWRFLAPIKETQPVNEPEGHTSETIQREQPSDKIAS